MRHPNQTAPRLPHVCRARASGAGTVPSTQPSLAAPVAATDTNWEVQEDSVSIQLSGQSVPVNSTPSVDVKFAQMAAPMYPPAGRGASGPRPPRPPFAGASPGHSYGGGSSGLRAGGSASTRRGPLAGVPDTVPEHSVGTGTSPIGGIANPVSGTSFSVDAIKVPVQRAMLAPATFGGIGTVGAPGGGRGRPPPLRPSPFSMLNNDPSSPSNTDHSNSGALAGAGGAGSQLQPSSSQGMEDPAYSGSALEVGDFELGGGLSEFQDSGVLHEQ